MIYELFDISNFRYTNKRSIIWFVVFFCVYLIILLFGPGWASTTKLMKINKRNLKCALCITKLCLCVIARDFVIVCDLFVDAVSQGVVSSWRSLQYFLRHRRGEAGAQKQDGLQYLCWTWWPSRPPEEQPAKYTNAQIHTYNYYFSLL